MARQYIGVREVEGKPANPTILAFFTATRLAPSSDETPWCAAFVNFCLKKSGIEGTNSAAARSFLQWGAPLLTPRVGCVAVFDRSSPTNPNAGHVGLWVADAPAGIRLLGGNQGDAVSITTYKRSSLLGYRWPEAKP